MSQLIPPPDYRKLLPPLLACLSTAFASLRPPPALLPLLSPVLRQRVQMLADTALSSTDSWLPLLCWKSDQAEKLVSVVEGDAFEIHPVSGEIDVGDVQAIQYKRFDEETLRAKLQLPDLGLSVTYVWCPEDLRGDKSTWSVAEVCPIEEQEKNSTGWSPSIIEASEIAENIQAACSQNGVGPAFRARSAQGKIVNGQDAIINDDEGSIDEDEEENYWAQYAIVPGRSPERKDSASDIESPARMDYQGATSDAEYYARYAHVQPEMDNDDPTQDRGPSGEYNLDGDVMRPFSEQNAGLNKLHEHTQMPNFDEAGRNSEVEGRHFSSPSSRATAVSRLEDSAVVQSASEVAIRQHVSASIKSLFRLTRGAGLDREEFNDLVRRELDTLSLVAEDD